MPYHIDVRSILIGVGNSPTERGDIATLRENSAGRNANPLYFPCISL